MAKRSDISDREAMEACWPWGGGTSAPGALSVLRDAGWPTKVAQRKLERLVDRRLVDYGVSINFPWRTLEGEAELARLRKVEDGD